MKRICCIICALFVLGVGDVAAQKSEARIKYIEQYKDVAIEKMRTHGIPASITLAQGCLESGNGLSELATKANNHFGIKCHKGWEGKTFYKMDDEETESCFRKYEKVEESFEDHSEFLTTRSRYASLFELDVTDYKGWARGLKEAGYATNPRYADQLIKIIEDYELYQYDGAKDDHGKLVMQQHIAEIIDAEGEFLERSYLYRYSKMRKVYEHEGVPYVVANEGDTYQSIAKEYNLFNKEIYKFNGVGRKTLLTPGTIVYLEKHKKE